MYSNMQNMKVIELVKKTAVFARRVHNSLKDPTALPRRPHKALSCVRGNRKAATLSL